MANEVSVREANIPAMEMELSVEQVVAQTDKILKLVELGMKENLHYGKIPGTPKPTLYQAGAEKLCLMFRLAPRYNPPNITRHGKHMMVVTNCELIHIPTGNVWASSGGMCTTEEIKYAYRKADRVCPECGKAAIRKDTKEGGYYCWRKLDGCGFQFKTAAAIATIESQPVGRIENEDVADQYNTILKIAEKRAFVSSVKSALAVSDTFTVDLDELNAEIKARNAESEESGGADIGGANEQPASKAANGNQNGGPNPNDKINLRQKQALIDLAHEVLHGDKVAGDKLLGDTLRKVVPVPAGGKLTWGLVTNALWNQCMMTIREEAAEYDRLNREANEQAGADEEVPGDSGTYQEEDLAASFVAAQTAKTTQAQETEPPPNAISDGQVSRMYAIAKSDRDLVHRIMAEHGYEHAAFIPKGSVYENIIDELKAAMAAGA